MISGNGPVLSFNRDLWKTRIGGEGIEFLSLVMQHLSCGHLPSSGSAIHCLTQRKLLLSWAGCNLQLLEKFSLGDQFPQAWRGRGSSLVGGRVLTGGSQSRGAGRLFPGGSSPLSRTLQVCRIPLGSAGHGKWVLPITCFHGGETPRGRGRGLCPGRP